MAGSGDEGTGPIALPDAPTPPSGLAGLPRGFADAPTPPSGTAFPAAASGQTHLAGYSGGPAPAPGAQPMQQPVAPVPPVAQQPYGAPGYAPPFGQPFAGQAGSPVPIAPGPQQPPAPPGQHPAAPPPVVRNAPPGLPPAGPPPAAPGAPRNAPPPMAPPPVVPGPPAAGPRNAPARWGPSAEPHYPQRPPEPVRAQPSAAAVPVGAPRQERESIVALFLVHMFPIGHLPVASDRPARQLPVPARDDATPVRLRCFPPHDHPRSAVVDSGQALAWLRQGWRQPAPPPAEVLPCPPDALRQGYDPLGGLHEREWDSRYLAEDGERVEYVWPPGERYPEGGTAEGEPELLAEGTLLDRFGTAHGRVFAPDGTPFAQRSLPPSYLEAGYRRYRVVREVPMWRTVSAGWFGQPGGGVRYRSVYSAAELVHLGYLADVTFKEVA
ncbi:glycohydrolase toxin TNT-related protein [Prauserella oleivorans]|uniref:TNT domain-containing protein n=1 Tax=Prauserella oleivorans TaxID=1478153 RepID=UPI003624DAB6